MVQPATNGNTVYSGKRALQILKQGSSSPGPQKAVISRSATKDPVHKQMTSIRQ